MATPLTINCWNDVVNLALGKADEPADYVPTASPVGTSDFAAHAALSALESFRDLCGRHPWLSLRKNPPGAFVTFAPVTSLTLTVPNSGLAVACTLSATYPTSLVGCKIALPGPSPWAYVTAHTGGSAALTLDAVGAQSVGANLSVTIMQDEYDLASDAGVLVSGLYSSFGYECVVWAEERLRVEYPGPITGSSWPPSAAARIGKSKIRFAQWPNQALRVEYQYCIEPLDPLTVDATGALTTGLQGLDSRLRRVWGLGATAILMLYKSDSRAQLLAQQYEAGIDDAWNYEHRLQVGAQSNRSRQAVKGLY